MSAVWSGAMCESHDPSFGCVGCEVRTEINKFGLDPGAKCEMLVKSPDDSQCTSSRCEFLSHHGKYSKYLKY